MVQKLGGSALRGDAPPDSSGDSMDLNLTGKHALVCGASEGIGRATAQELALLGASVTVLARRAEALQEVAAALPRVDGQRSEEHTSELQSLMRISYAVFCLKNKTTYKKK